MVKADGVAQEGRMVDEVEAGPVLWYFALGQQLLSQLYGHAWLEHLGVPQTVDHEDQVVVELLAQLTADMKDLLKRTWKEGEREKE